MRPRRDEGESLVEILVALAILGIGITALVTALGVNASTTVTNRSQAQISSTLLQASEVVKAMHFATVCTGGSLTPVPLDTAAVPRDNQFDVRYRPAVRFGTEDDPAPTPCDPSSSGTTLASVRVQVSGDGFTARYVDVPVRRQLP